MENKSLEKRIAIKKKKPTFLRQDGHKKVRLGNKWRRPKGGGNKVRLGYRGYRRKVTKGFKSPRDVRGLHKTGLEEIRVSRIEDIEGSDPVKQGIVIPKSVGQKKRIEIIHIAESKKITILSMKNTAEFIRKVEAEFEKKKKLKEEAKKKTKKKEEKTEKKEEKVKTKKTDKKELTEKEKKLLEKKEKDRILTQKK